MGQQKHILHAALILGLAAIGYLLIRKLSSIQSVAPEQENVLSHDKAGMDEELFIEGKTVFWAKCTVCHPIHKNDGDRLIASIQNDFWSSTEKIAQYLRAPEMFREEEYIKRLMEKFGTKTPHLKFPAISDREVKAIYLYVTESP
ncbi:MAG: hypothetical protein BGO52_20465 [Sphingobacteriales bacterium 44-61]|nr:MAG: hypothetical protein BGO52_20465 [Sphingobacteriales bacterium 44-61]